MDWKSATVNEGATKIPDRWLHLYYYEALNILFRFENALRIFVYVILKKELQGKWDSAAISEGATIRTETKKRIAQAREHGYLGYEVSSPMLYLNSGELTQIITSEAYWKYFGPYFKASKSIILTKLQEIGTVRNSLAHFRPLKEDDIDLIKQNSKHVLLQIEDCLTQLTSLSQVVPSNSDEGWYKELKSIGNEHLSTSLFFSRDQNWIRVELGYKVPVLKRTQYGEEYFSYSVGNIRTSQILATCKAIRENCVYVCEAPTHGTLDEQNNIVTKKRISLIFPRATLTAALNEIANEIRDASLKIDNETELVSQDSLARGDLVEVKSATAMYKRAQNGQGYWSVQLQQLQTTLTDVDEVEFWGERTQYAHDFVSATAHYPWMPSSVSNPSWGF
ncbi:Swt1 family HEPN domain-containing protein [Massilia horti]|uniref:Uncharacterized protein n=1 Tax=Massilia horti TaxID=2562153 RepID=A0A4Y9SV38_9BURK|nr:Swt1 family HEPN domain-containing protein [Massilia horti]TFW28513.1 hypothetical protein E4O92_21135 [Massilia horti]